MFLVLVSCSKKEKIQPTAQTLVESVYASATIQPDSLYQVHAIVGGILDVNLVAEGDLVTKEQSIIQIINNTSKLNTQNAKFSLELAKDNYEGRAAILGSIKDEIAATQLKYKNDSLNYFRQKNLWNQNIGSKLEYDTKKLQYELSSNELKRLQSKYHRTENELQTAVKQAKNVYESSLITTKDYNVKSKINGKVYALYKEPGEIVNTVESLASIGSATNFVIELLVDEVDIVKVQQAQEVLLHLDAYNGVVFNAKISKIYPKKDERNQTFTVKAVFDTMPDVLFPGLSGEANIVIATKENVLTIPKTYLIEHNKVKTDEGIITITTGMQNMEFVEVTAGLTRETYIYKPEE
jgi:multidrug efflux pump subunit AcrA (membrane-fusion protein)